MDESSPKFQALSEKIAAIVAATPPDLIHSVLLKLPEWDSQNWPLSQTRALASIHHPQVRADLMSLFDLWEQTLPDLPGSALALALSSALAAHLQGRQMQVDLVWTGPESKVLPLRRTDQALLQLIHGAKSRLLIVSFAVYKIEPIVKALEAALQRGVALKIILESPEHSQGKVTFASEKAFGNGVLSAAQVYVWPLEKRIQTPEGKHGSLHAKVAVADGKTLFISSANLTEYAMNLNMEMGVLVHGGKLPKDTERHFEELIGLEYIQAQKNPYDKFTLID